MKTKTILPKSLLFIVTILFSFSGFSQWNNLAASANYSFKDVIFSSQNVGYALVDSSSTKYLFKTQNAGVTWQNLNLNFSPITGVDMQCIYFADDNTGYIVFRGNDGGMNSYVFQTVDGGANWANKTPNNLPLGYGVSDVFFTDTNTGFVGIGEVICKTNDGGNNWTTTTLSNYNSPNEIDFFDGNNGIVGAWDGTFAYQGIIYTTTNGGLSWDSLVLNTGYTVITDVAYVNNNTAFALTSEAWMTEQKIYKTVDNGLIWDTLFLGFLLDSADAAADMYFVNDTLGYLSTNKGYVFKTIDGGLNWNEEHFETPYLDIIAYNGNDIFIGGPLSTLITNNTSTGLSDIVVKSNNNIYPNPIKNGGLLSFDKPITGILQIISLNGQVIESQQLNRSKNILLNNSLLVQGVYIISIKGEYNLIKKLIVY